MKKRIKKKIKKLKKSINKINKVRVQKGRKAMLQETWATVTYGLYDNRKIRRLKKFPPALVENRMLFETNDDFTDNGRALFDYLIEKGYNKKYEIVWLVHEPSKYKEYQFENVKFVQNFKNGSTIRRAEAYKYALTSKYIFYTQAFNWIGMSRRNQLFIDLWHGCGYKANKNGRKVFFDYCLVPGDIFIKTKMEFFGCTSKKLLSFGYPRYDMMLKGSERADEYKKKLLKETDSEKLILWMPTYRHASSESHHFRTDHFLFTGSIFLFLPGLQRKKCAVYAGDGNYDDSGRGNDYFQLPDSQRMELAGFLSGTDRALSHICNGNLSVQTVLSYISDFAV